MAEFGHFVMTNDHWKTEPKWSDGAFCGYTGLPNDTYQCIRGLNRTHNYLYCEFITGFIEYYDLNNDPYQLLNSVKQLSALHVQTLHDLLLRLKSCVGRAQCSVKNGRPLSAGPQLGTSSPAAQHTRPPAAASHPP